MSTDISPKFFNAPGQRWHDLDAVRALALLSGVALHGVMAYMSPRVWIIGDSHTSGGADVLFYVIHIFRMTLFFMLAGFFARQMMASKGVAGFVGNRLKRIALPLVAFWPLVMAAIVVMLIVANPAAPGAAPVPPPPLGVNTFPLTHLWFLYALLLLYAGAVIVKLMTDLLHIGGWLGRRLDAVVTGLTRWDLISLVLAAPVAAVFYANPHWMMWFGIATPDTGLVPNTMAVTGFTTAFLFGWWLNRSPDLLDHIARRTWVYGLAAAAGTWWCLSAVGQAPVLAPADGHAHPLYAIIYPLTTWSWTLALVGAARLALRRENPLIRRLADASYWIYIVHVPLVLLFQWLVLPLDLVPIGKFAIVLSATLLTGLLSYQLVVRYSFIGTILNGRKRKPKPAAFIEEARA